MHSYESDANSFLWKDPRGAGEGNREHSAATWTIFSVQRCLWTEKAESPAKIRSQDLSIVTIQDTHGWPDELWRWGGQLHVMRYFSHCPVGPDGNIHSWRLHLQGTWEVKGLLLYLGDEIELDLMWENRCLNTLRSLRLKFPAFWGGKAKEVFVHTIGALLSLPIRNEAFHTCRKLQLQ